MPTIQHEALLRELWCHNYYLRNLCDAARFADWPIAQPVELLKAVMEAWRAEREKGAPDVTDAQVRRLLGPSASVRASAPRLRVHFSHSRMNLATTFAHRPGVRGPRGGQGRHRLRHQAGVPWTGA
jgi:hypothetical protein